MALQTNGTAHYAAHEFITTNPVGKDGFLTEKQFSKVNGIKASLLRKISGVDGDKIDQPQRAQAAESLLSMKDIASHTYARPRGKAAVSEAIDGWIHNKERVLSFRISPRDLATVHPGSVSVKDAKHLHPYEPGNTSNDQYEDENLITIVWRYPQPKKNQIHAEPIVLTDGTLIAAFRTDDASDAKMAEFRKHQYRVFDRINGNKYAMDPNGLKRAFNNTIYRFRSYFRGINEGLSVPRFNGSIGANLLLTSLPISALLYCLIYAIDYTVTNRNLQKHKLDHYAKAVAAANLQAQTVPNQNPQQNAGAPPSYVTATGGPPPSYAAAMGVPQPPSYATVAGSAYAKGTPSAYGPNQFAGIQAANPGMTV